MLYRLPTPGIWRRGQAGQRNRPHRDGQRVTDNATLFDIHRTLDFPFTRGSTPDEAAHTSAQRVDECLGTAWERAENLYQAFEPWEQMKTKEQVEEILQKHKSQISAMERIKLEADGMGDIDWRTSLLQGAIDDATHRLKRRLRGISFNELKRSRPQAKSSISR
jgi:hypothetical protein